MNKVWINISFVYLVIVALLGTFLRYMSFNLTDLNYSYLLHAHSHIAFLGWLFNIFFTILVYTFLNHEYRDKKKYQKFFWFTQLANVGMLVSFSVQGYGLYSIAFSTLHILLSFYFAIQFLSDAGKNPLNKTKNYLSFGFVKASVIFMLISALGPLSLGPIISLKGVSSELYYNAIYFYLHFQYNGWFSFAVLALFFRFLEKNNINFSFRMANIFYYCMLVSCIPSYLLSVLWMKPGLTIYTIAGLSAFIQLIGLIFLVIIIFKIKNELLKKYGEIVSLLMFIALFCFFTKVILQQLAAIPFVADKVYQSRNFIIGYMHMVFIGFITFYLIGYLITENIMPRRKILKTAMKLIVFGFITSEITLFVQGFIGNGSVAFLSMHMQLLFYASLITAIGIVVLTFNQLMPKSSG